MEREMKLLTELEIHRLHERAFTKQDGLSPEAASKLCESHEFLRRQSVHLVESLRNIVNEVDRTTPDSSWQKAYDALRVYEMMVSNGT